MNTILLWMCPLTVFSLGCLSAEEKGDAVSSLNAPASLPVPGLSVRLAADGKSWLTADRLKEARDLILEGKQMKKPFFMDREVPCLRDAYLLSAPEDEHVVIFLQYRKNAYAWTSDDKEATGTKPVPGKGLRVTSGNGVLVETFGMHDEAVSVEEAVGWVSLFLPMRDRVECVRGTKMNGGVSSCTLNGKDPLFNRDNAETIVRYIFSRSPLPMLHGSMYGSLPYYPVDGTPYAVYLLPKGQFAPIKKPEDVAGLDFCYNGLPNGRGATSVAWKGESMNWYGWYPPQYMLDMSGEAFLALLRKAERDAKADASANMVWSGQLSSMPLKASHGAVNTVVSDEGGRINLRSVKDARLRILAHSESRKPGAEGETVPYLPSYWDMYLVSDPDDADRPVIFLRSPYQPEGRAEQGIRLSVGENGDVLAATVGFKVADELASALPGMAMFLCSPQAATVSEDTGIIVYFFTRSAVFGTLQACAAPPPWVYGLEGTPYDVRMDRFRFGFLSQCMAVGREQGHGQSGAVYFKAPFPVAAGVVRKALLREMELVSKGEMLPPLGATDSDVLSPERQSWVSPDGMRSMRDKVLAHGERKFLKPFGKEFPCLPGFREVYLLSDPESENPVLFIRLPAEGDGVKGLRLSLLDGGFVYAEAVGFDKGCWMADYWAEVFFPVERNPKTGMLRLLYEQGEDATLNERHLQRILDYAFRKRPPFASELSWRPEGGGCEVFFRWSGDMPSSMQVRRLDAEGKAGDPVEVAWWGNGTTRGMQEELKKCLFLEAGGSHEGGTGDMRLLAETAFRAVLDEMGAADTVAVFPSMKSPDLNVLRNSIVKRGLPKHLPAEDRTVLCLEGSWDAFLLSDPSDEDDVAVYLRCPYQDGKTPKDRALRVSSIDGGKKVKVESLGLCLEGMAPDKLAAFARAVMWKHTGHVQHADSLIMDAATRDRLIRFALGQKLLVTDGSLRYHIGGSDYYLELAPYRSLGALPHPEYVADLRFIRMPSDVEDSGKEGLAEMLREMDLEARLGPLPRPDAMVSLYPPHASAGLSDWRSRMSAAKRAVLSGNLPKDRVVTLLSAAGDEDRIDLSMPIVSATGSKGLRVTLDRNGAVHVEAHGLMKDIRENGDLVDLAKLLLADVMPWEGKGSCKSTAALEDGRDALVNRVNRKKIVGFLMPWIRIDQLQRSGVSSLRPEDACYRPTGTPYEVRLLTTRGEISGTATGSEETGGLSIRMMGKSGAEVVRVVWNDQACPALARYLSVSGGQSREHALKVVREVFEAVLRDEHAIGGRPWPLRQPDFKAVEIGGDLAAVRAWILEGKEKKWSYLAQDEMPYRPGRWDAWLLSDPEEKDYVVVYMKCPYQAEGMPEKGLRLSWLGPNRIRVESFGIPRTGISIRNLRALAGEVISQVSWQEFPLCREFDKETASRMMEYVLAMRSVTEDRAYGGRLSWYYDIPGVTFRAYLRPYTGVLRDQPNVSSTVLFGGIEAPEYIRTIEFADTSDRGRIVDRAPGDALLKEMARYVAKVSLEDGRDTIVTSKNRDRIVAFLRGKIVAMWKYGAMYGLPPVYRVEGTPFHVIPLFDEADGRKNICLGLRICPVPGADGFPVEMRWKPADREGETEVFDFSMRSYRGWQDGDPNAQGRADALDTAREVFSALLREADEEKL